MRAYELDRRLLEALEENEIFWPMAERYTCLNEAARMLALLKPEVFTKRLALSLLPEELFLDLRQVASDLLTLDQVVVGDVSVHPPLNSAGLLRHLRRTTLISLRAYQHWGLRRAEAPQYYLRFGLSWLIVWPRPIQTLTLTLIYRAAPPTMNPLDGQASVPLSDAYALLVVRLAAVIAMAKEGAGTVQEGMQMLQTLFGQDRFSRLPRQTPQPPQATPQEAA